MVKWRDPGSQAWLPAGEAKKFIKWFLTADNGRRTNAARERAWSGSHKRKFERVWKRALRKARGNLEAARLGEIAEVKEAIKDFKALIKATPHWQLKRLKQKELAVWQAHLKSLTVAEVPPGFSPVVKPPFEARSQNPLLLRRLHPRPGGERPMANGRSSTGSARRTGASVSLSTSLTNEPRYLACPATARLNSGSSSARSHSKATAWSCGETTPGSC